MTEPSKLHTQPLQPEHDPVPSTPLPEPQQEIPAQDPPVLPERDREIVFDEDEVAK